MTQYFFVDESGEPGLHSVKSSPYYVLVMAQLPDSEPIAEFAALRRALRLAPGFEFHYYQMTAPQKQAFFGAIRPVPFRVRSAVLLKTEMPSLYQSLSGAELNIELITRLTLRASPLDIANDIIVLDGATDSLRKHLRIHLSRECERIGRVRPYKKIATASSSRDDGLQLADMLAGAIRTGVLMRTAAYHQMFASKIVDLWRVK